MIDELVCSEQELATNDITPKEETSTYLISHRLMAKNLHNAVWELGNCTFESRVDKRQIFYFSMCVN